MILRLHHGHIRLPRLPHQRLTLLNLRSLQTSPLRPSSHRIPPITSLSTPPPSPSPSPSHSTTPPPPPPQPQTWLTNLLPKPLLPYAHLARLDKPIGSYLLYWPCFWSISMSAYTLHTPPLQTLTMLGLFGAGAVIMRGAGCTINDLWDRDLDRGVERTRGRPLASGEVSVGGAFGFLGVQLVAGAAVLTQLPVATIPVALASLPIITAYPFMKRVTYFPQITLGLAFNWGALLGPAAMFGHLHSMDMAVWGALYASGICWTLVYDTIYAHQDKRDDALVGIKSTALYFGDRTPAFLALLSTAQIGLLACAGYLNAQGPLFYLGTVGAAVHLARILGKVEYDDREDCWRWFRACTWTGAIIGAGVVGDWGWRVWRDGVREQEEHERVGEWIRRQLDTYIDK
ncbi:Para-hydroxybenzoate--polyprenyltransferase, mitochondrial precursor (PHB:polyprenyltransferase) [Saitoella coloradoensis]